MHGRSAVQIDTLRNPFAGPPYSEVSFELDGVVGVQRIDLETGYRDCCDKKTVITWHIETFNGGGL